MANENLAELENVRLYCKYTCRHYCHFVYRVAPKSQTLPK